MLDSLAMVHEEENSLMSYVIFCFKMVYGAHQLSQVITGS